MHTQTSNTKRNTCEKTTRAVTLGNNCMLRLFGLVLNLRHFDLFPSEELPDASSVVLIAQSVQEGVEGGWGLSQDGSHLQKGAARIRGLLVRHNFSRAQPEDSIKMVSISQCWDFCISIEGHFRVWLFSKGKAVWVHYHPELGWDQVGVLHGGVEGQDAVRTPAEQHGFKRSVGVELQSGGEG